MQSRATRAEAFLSLLPLPFFPSRLLRDNFSYRGGWDFISLSPPLLFSGTRWNESWGDKGVNYYIDKKSISRALVIQFFFYFFFFAFLSFFFFFFFSWITQIGPLDKLREIIGEGETIFRIFSSSFFPYTSRVSEIDRLEVVDGDG